MELNFQEINELRKIMIDWLNDGFKTPPYNDEIYSLIKKFGISQEEVSIYDLKKPKEAAVDATAMVEKIEDLLKENTAETVVGSKNSITWSDLEKSGITWADIEKAHLTWNDLGNLELTRK